ncbi:MAG TPA: GtrA family protein [Dongiaceae bacterium]|nr:GtrA family protein [Dongiaceae bacterium]
MTSYTLALRYTAIATSASMLNLLLQAIITWIYDGPLDVEGSIVIATGIVLPLKYSVERRLIFKFQPDSLLHDAKLFYLYTVVSVFTVLIFWCTEYAFHLIFEEDIMRYLGGAIGLAISFYSKYRLDRHFVFVRKPAREIE